MWFMCNPLDSTVLSPWPRTSHTTMTTILFTRQHADGAPDATAPG
jgi:hypothetical protein